MISQMQAERPFVFVGEWLCLDLVNTELVDGGARIDLLGSFDRLVSWCVGGGILTAREAQDVSSRWGGRSEAGRTLEKAVALRALLRDMAERLSARRARLPAASLEGINEVLRARAGHRAVVRTAEAYETRYRDRFTEAAHVLVPIAESAADLLTAGDLTLVRKCQNPRCILYFYDTTKNHARRWCSMTVCGNRAKVAAHYRRTRQEPAAPARTR